MRKLNNEELERKTISEFRSSTKNPLVIVLDNVRSMNNVGSVFRTSDAFLVEKICLCGITAKPPHREIHKTALGSTESVTWEYYEKTSYAINTLRNQNYTIVLIEQTDSSVLLHAFQPEENKKYAFVFGNEIEGIGEELLPLSDFSIEIPQFGFKHSLNISVTVGIVIWDMVRKNINKLQIKDN